MLALFYKENALKFKTFSGRKSWGGSDSPGTFYLDMAHSIHCPIRQGQLSSISPMTALFLRRARQGSGGFPGLHPLIPRKRSRFINSARSGCQRSKSAGPGPSRASRTLCKNWPPSESGSPPRADRVRVSPALGSEVSAWPARGRGGTSEGQDQAGSGRSEAAGSTLRCQARPSRHKQPSLCPVTPRVPATGAGPASRAASGSRPSRADPRGPGRARAAYRVPGPSSSTLAARRPARSRRRRRHHCSGFTGALPTFPNLFPSPPRAARS